MPQVYGRKAWVADRYAATINAASIVDMTMDLRTSRVPTSFKGLPKMARNDHYSQKKENMRLAMPHVQHTFTVVCGCEAAQQNGRLAITQHSIMHCNLPRFDRLYLQRPTRRRPLSGR